MNAIIVVSIAIFDIISAFHQQNVKEMEIEQLNLNLWSVLQNA